MENNFKRFAAVISLSLIASIAIVPCAAFFVSAQTTDTVISSTDAQETLNEATFKANQIMADKSSKDTVLRAQAFDAAKKNTEETLAVIEENEAAEAEKLAQQAVVETPVETSKKPAASTSTQVSGGNYLLNIGNPDPNYKSYSITLDAYDRDILERLVMGEAGAEGFIGAALVAQAIRDTMIADGYPTVESVRTSCGYYGSLYLSPNQDVLNAVSFIFDEGGAVVPHRLLYFYAPAVCYSGWHESQEFVVEHNGHRFFDRW